MIKKNGFSLFIGIFFLCLNQAFAQNLRDPWLDRVNTEKEFNDTIDKVVDSIRDIAKHHGIGIEVSKFWRSNIENSGGGCPNLENMTLMFFGGMARHPKMTRDGLAALTCHEIGHCFVRFPSNLHHGEIEYFTSQICLRRVFGNQVVDSERLHASTPLLVRQKCDTAWNRNKDRDLCYRIALSQYSSLATAATISGSKDISFSTPDSSIVEETQELLSDQCRLDSALAGALCKVEADHFLFPQSEEDQKQQSCFANDGYQIGTRPACWFKET